MISVSEAQALIEQNCVDFGKELIPLEGAITKVLAEEICADRDFPPFDRVTMDGIAICKKAFDEGKRTYKIEGIQAAGTSHITLNDNDNCLEVMTGAVLPVGTDLVIPYEDILLENGFAFLKIQNLKSNQNIHIKGTDAKMGKVLVPVDTIITPAIVGLLATVGKSLVWVKRLPKIAICSTGDELVPVEETPMDYQIRKSNNYMLFSGLLELGMVADQVHLQDDLYEMHQSIQHLIKEYDVVLFSGAVSKGKFDLLPQVFTGLGVEIIFHKVAQKPGKPFLFARAKTGALMFGFPGNPVSTMVCFQIYFKHWLAFSLKTERPFFSATLAEDVHFKPELDLHLLVTLKLENGVLMAKSCTGANSGDLVTLALADGIMSLPAKQSFFQKGAAYQIFLLRGKEF